MLSLLCVAVMTGLEVTSGVVVGVLVLTTGTGVTASLAAVVGNDAFLCHDGIPEVKLVSFCGVGN